MPITETGDVLGDAMMAAVDALSVEQKRDRRTVWRAMGQAIIAHLIANGTSAVVTTCPAGAGTGSLV